MLVTIPQKTKILLDAEVGNIYLNPSEEIISSFKDRNDARAGFKRRKPRIKAVTTMKDGARVRLLPIVIKERFQSVGIWLMMKDISLTF